MNKFDDDDFNASEYSQKMQKRHKRIAIGLIITAIVAFSGMAVFWH